MSEDKNLVNKSIEDLEKEKLQAEIHILQATLEKEFPDEKPPTRLDKIAEFFRKWSAFILGSVTLISAVWGVFLPLSDYLEERRKALEYELNENMIEFVDGLNSEDPNIANRSVMMLSYYEVNSIPILLFFLETSREEEFREKIIETIALIYSDERGTEIVDIVIRRIENNFNQIVEDHTLLNGEINAKRRLTMLNYLELVDGLKLRRLDRRQVEGVYEDIRNMICQDKSLEDNILTIHWQVSDYLGLDYNCNAE